MNVHVYSMEIEESIKSLLSNFLSENAIIWKQEFSDNGKFDSSAETIFHDHLVIQLMLFQSKGLSIQQTIHIRNWNKALVKFSA